MDSWNSVREYLSYHEKKFITEFAEEVEKQYTIKDIEIADVENVWILANTWNNVENVKKSAFWYEKALCIVKEELGENHELYADALVEYTDYYEVIYDFKKCEDFYDKAIKIYNEKQMKYLSKGRVALQRRAIVYRRQSKFTEALEIYRDLLHYQIGKYRASYNDIYHYMGSLLGRSGLADDAIAFYQYAVKIREKVYGEKSELTESSYEQMAYVLYKGFIFVEKTAGNNFPAVSESAKCI